MNLASSGAFPIPGRRWLSTSPSISRIADTAEKLVLLTLLLALAFRLVPDWRTQPANLVYLAQEVVVIVMIAIRQAAGAITHRKLDWVSGFAGTFLPLLVQPDGAFLSTTGALLVVLGLVVAVSGQLSLARGFGVVAANRGIRTGGMYRLVRHPIYLGHVLGSLGFFMTHASYWNAAVALAWATCQIYRIRAEERLLSQDPAYVRFKSRVQYRVIPLVY